ncbi:MAG: hypothetical protein R3E39_23900 [Anaerolineae bacterium]
MPITIYWDNPQKTIIRLDFQGSYNWNDFVEATKAATRLMLEVAHPVSILANMRPGNMPKNGNAIAIGRSAIQRMPANFDLLILVTNPLVEVLGNAFRHLDREFREKMILVKSVEEAYEVLAQSPANSG